MSEQDQRADDPLAALAKATATAMRNDDASRAAMLEARKAESARSRNLVRILSFAAVVAVVVGVLVFQAPRMFDPYYAEDPLADSDRAKVYITGLLDEVSAYRAAKGGALPSTLELAVPQSRLPPPGSGYRVVYRIEGDVPVVTLEGGREPVIVRGASR